MTIEEGTVQLAPRGETPFNHWVSIHEGSLALYWQQGKETRIRTFTRDETEVLLIFLNRHRNEIITDTHDEIHIVMEATQ